MEVSAFLAQLAAETNSHNGGPIVRRWAITALSSAGDAFLRRRPGSEQFILRANQQPERVMRRGDP